ncbi:efflux RND transporter permease subunit [Acidomonas methanolica]|uniref:Heavy metal efflux pump, cobalt/zinc/cadmium resistance protein CzcA n=1 Tax=Acidomonas methanolica NBRC 104435 TaxID=1231351 RepID=A0A023D258_ACIMT|nr:CusA/CzcA family heavy metal efflux RND transporter [Acidomonas methanolica]MBU2655351.1 CusA/CzcA family heavy metal efflux RND transporter [Acidomonas methanolica]TCS23768.1 Cu(I)/Ag(I) efflux system membrane protein CusA/SilA [Acidomonas methanolica]GAJ27855.1 heavy metal efflux pump, cobalt/zinc/cadmium resistance protein CzcA [Acidomonas methanolica NBRC 104435]GBQ46576.1 putative silver efflux pump [Acidomonas methanolica]GEL00239.1 cation efflux system protein [Acidomonas methanolica
MIARIIRRAADNRFLILLGTLFVAVAGYYSLTHVSLDAVPDLSDTQVIVQAAYEGQAPRVVEDQVTYPLTSALLDVPGAVTVRGQSMFGNAFVYVIFKDGTDLYWARSRVLEALNALGDRLPAGVRPVLGPDATGVGWVYEYVLVAKNRTLAELRSLQDWYVRYGLEHAEGVSEVAAIGGFVREYQVVVDPRKLEAYGVPLSAVMRAVGRSNRDTGGRVVEMSEREYLVQGHGYIRSLDDLRKIPLRSRDGTPVRLGDLALVRFGPDERRGLADLDGEGEVAGGVVLQRFGQNALDVIGNVKRQLRIVEAGLPADVSIKAVYDRSALIRRAIFNLRHTLIEESAIVAAVCMIFLMHARSALVAILVLPVGIMLAFIVMYALGIGSNIMSLGGIAIALGAMVDAAIVMIENVHKHLEKDDDPAHRRRIVLDAACEVGPALFFSLLIITVSFLPIFSLQGQEGRLFRPLAYTKSLSMAAAALLSVTLVPVLMTLLIRGRIVPEARNPVNRLLVRAYRPVIGTGLRHPWVTVLLSLVVLTLTLWPASRIGSEFMPELREGTLLYMPTTLPGISIGAAKALLQTEDRIIKSFPEVSDVFGKTGRADTATDPAPLSMNETIIGLKPEDEWPSGMTQEKLIDAMNAALTLPGVTNAWTQPIKGRNDMLSTGIRTPVGIKIFGRTLADIEATGERIERALHGVRGTASVYAERVAGGYYLDILPDRDALARYDLTVGDLQDVIATALGGKAVTTIVKGNERYPVNIRYPQAFRSDPDSIARDVLIPFPGGGMIPLGQVATVSVAPGPQMIRTENAALVGYVYVDIRDRDLGGYVADAQRAVREKVKLPTGCYLEWSGQFRNMQDAKARLEIVIPATLLIIVVLLYLNFANLTDTLIVFCSLPFSLIGGLWLMYWLGFNMSVAVAVGFIAMTGLAAQTGVVMLVYLDNAYARARSACAETGAPFDLAALHDAVIAGSVQRVRPILMTVCAIFAGLLPNMWSHGTGSEIMRRIVTPMIGGVVSSTALTLVLLPVVYALVKRRACAEAPR